jgi:CheY-like chemotaxis protein
MSHGTRYPAGKGRSRAVTPGIQHVADPTSAARILLAEDDSDLRSLLADWLREDGHQVVEAEDGTALLDRLAEALASDQGFDAYDLIVTDINMPGYHAFDIMSGMRRKMADIPFILITGFGDAMTRIRAERLGAAAVLDKPIDADELRRVVVEVLGQRPRWS